MRAQRSLAVLAGVVLVVAAACSGAQGRRAVAGGATVNDERVLVPNAAPPDRITVMGFDADPGAVKKGSGLVEGVESAVGERQGGILGGGGPLRRRIAEDQPSTTDVVSLLATSITKGLSSQNLGVPVFQLPPGAPPPAYGWLVDGRILSVDPGNRAERAVVGFGAGEATAEVQAYVDQLGPTGATRLLEIGVDADSGKMPGGAVAKNPYAMAAKFVIGRKATDKDIEKLGAEIAKQVADYARGRAAAPR